MHKLDTLFFIYLSIIAAFFLAYLPLPEWASWGRPTWVVLVLIYWTLVLPQHIGIGTAWLVGLILDLSTNQPFGAHAFALVFISYFLLRFQQALRGFSLITKIGVIFVLLFAYQLWVLWLVGGNWHAYNLSIGLLQAGISILLWPWLALLLSLYQHRLKLETNY